METVRLVDKCFSFRICFTGHQGLGKTTFLEGLKLVDSFEKLANGAPPPRLDNINPPPTQFVEMHPVELPIPSCFELSKHRIYIYDTPSDKPVLRDGMMERRMMEGGIDAIVLFTDGTTSKTALAAAVDRSCADFNEAVENLAKEEQYLPKFARSGIHAHSLDASEITGRDHHSIENVARLAKKTDSALLVVNLGAPLDSSVQELLQDNPRFRCIACGKRDFVQLAGGFIDFLQALHSMKQDEVDTRRETERRLDAQKQVEMRRKHPIPLPVRAHGQFEWNESHVSDPTMTLNMALYGAPDTGKSTFATALLDGFSLRTYEPTVGLEQGSFSVCFGPHKMNITLFDGAVQRLPLVGIALVFVDLSSPNGIEDATRAVIGTNFPPTVCVVGTKGDKGVVLDPMDLQQFAGNLPAHFAEIDARKVQMELVVSILQGVADTDKKLRAKVARCQQLSKNPNSRGADTSSLEATEVPTTEEGLRFLFHRYDLDGNGFIEFSEAEQLFEEYNRAGFGNCGTEIKRILEKHRITLDKNRLNFDQFSILMCALAKM